MSLNLFPPKTFKPARWKRTQEPEMNFECVMIPTRPEQKPIDLYSEPYTMLFGSKEEGDAYLAAIDRYIKSRGL